MNYVLLTEGTGQGTGERSNVSRLAAALVRDNDQRVCLETGCGTRFGTILMGRLVGADAVDILLRQYEWLAQQGAARRPDAAIFVFGFSRGALIARALCDLICRCGIASDAYDARRVFKYHRANGYGEALAAFRREGRLTEPRRVRYLGLWDTVDSTVGLDGAALAVCPSNVAFARHAVARDETRRFYTYLPLTADGGSDARQDAVEELAFPGTHSDVGGTYADNHLIADVALAWVANRAVSLGLRLKPGVVFREDIDLADAKIHDPSFDASNAWGRFDPIARSLKNVREHASCAKVKTGLLS